MIYYVGYRDKDKLKGITSTRCDNLKDIIEYTFNYSMDELREYLYSNKLISYKDAKLFYIYKPREGYKIVSPIFTNDQIYEIDIEKIVEDVKDFLTEEEQLEYFYIERMKDTGYFDLALKFFRKQFFRKTFTDYILTYPQDIYDSKLKNLINEYLNNIVSYDAKKEKDIFYSILNELFYYDPKNLIKKFEGEFIYLNGINIPREIELLKSLYNSRPLDTSNEDEIRELVYELVEYNEVNETINPIKYFELIVLMNIYKIREYEKLNKMIHKEMIDEVEVEKPEPQFENNVSYDEYLEEKDFERINSNSEDEGFKKLK